MLPRYLYWLLLCVFWKILGFSKTLTIHLIVSLWNSSPVNILVIALWKMWGTANILKFATTICLVTICLLAKYHNDIDKYFDSHKQTGSDIYEQLRSYNDVLRYLIIPFIVEKRDKFNKKRTELYTKFIANKIVVKIANVIEWLNSKVHLFANYIGSKISSIGWVSSFKEMYELVNHPQQRTTTLSSRQPQNEMIDEKTTKELEGAVLKMFGNNLGELMANLEELENENNPENMTKQSIKRRRKKRPPKTD